VDFRIRRGGVNVEFFADPLFQEVFPKPQPANKYLPKYFKELAPQLTADPESSTVKRCVPFLDAATIGYIIPMWTDVFVTARDGEINVKFPNSFPMPDSLGKHGPDQIRGHPYKNHKYGNMPLKWINPWGIKTPKGYSCLFTSPLNHLERRLKILDGIVDTDTYYNHIHFPFLWIEEKEGEFLIEKGTPLIHVIPFKREKFTSTFTEVNMEKYKEVRGKIGTLMRNKYRTFFWHKRK
tara:strand:+ start:2375 stop:3085 length:711 start_codon:yes stop_codon:yes gene_type:complete